MANPAGKICGDCSFRIDGKCCRYPPSQYHDGKGDQWWLQPDVGENKQACAEYDGD